MEKTTASANKFREAELEATIIERLKAQGYPHVVGANVAKAPSEVIIEQDLRGYLAERYCEAGLTSGEISSIIKMLNGLSQSDLYHSNKDFCQWLSDGFLFKREDSKQKDLLIELIDYNNVNINLKQMFQPLLTPANIISDARAFWPQGHDSNIYRQVSQLKIEGIEHTRIPDLILYINGLPLVVCEFKSTIDKNATIFTAYEQLTKQYRRDIPKLFVYNAFCVISDGVNSKMGTLFSPYEFYYAWRKVTGDESIEQQGISALNSMIEGLFNPFRLRDVIRHFIFFPAGSRSEVKIICRYPQYYAANKLYQHILVKRKPMGDGKGGTYFGATGCGKSYTMQFLTRLLMKSLDLKSPTIVLITDRSDLDDQLSKQFGSAKDYIGDQTIIAVTSRAHLREQLQGRNSGGVFLTTIQKFSEDIEKLSQRSNIICISDEAHRSQLNLDQKVRVIEKDNEKILRRSFGFARYLHDSLPNATFVGFTGTPIDATLAVFGQVVDSYTMTESVKDEITVRIVYEGRAAKVILDNSKLQEIEHYYQQCLDEGANDYQVEESKKASSSMQLILGDDDRINALAQDLVAHYEKRVDEGSSLIGKAIVVSSAREIAYKLYNAIKDLRPQWFKAMPYAAGLTLSKEQIDKIKPSEKVKMVMTRQAKDDAELYQLLGSDSYRKSLDAQFKDPLSNFKIAIVVDMWLTGFDVPELDTIYIDKPIQKHNLIQTISRVNRKLEGKNKGLVVDYIGIKKPMNQALKKFSKQDSNNFEDIQQSIVVVKDHLDLLATLFHHFDTSPYFSFEPIAQLECLNDAANYVLQTKKLELRFMALVKRLKAAYDICCGSDKLSQNERDHIHFYLAIRTIVFKLTKGDAPDTAQMNAKVRQMVAEALKADGVEEIFKLGNEEGTIDLFDEDYLAKIDQVKLPNTKIELLQQLLTKAIEQYKRVNKTQGIDFSKRFKALVEKYNERRESEAFSETVHQDFYDEVISLMAEMKKDMASFSDLNISFEEKAFYDILKKLTLKHDFSFPQDKLLELAKAVKAEVDDKTKYTDWDNRDDIKAGLRANLILLLSKYGYPPITINDVYQEVYDQAENFKKYQVEGS